MKDSKRSENEPKSRRIIAFTPDQALKGIGDYEGAVYMDGYNLTKAKNLEALETHKGPLTIRNAGNLTEEIADRLSRHDGSLTLQVAELSLSVVRSLTRHKGRISFVGLKEISGEVARILGSHDGDLALDDLLEVTESVALGLRNNRHDLSIEGIEVISRSATTILSKKSGTINGLPPAEWKAEVEWL
jgi:hypothetical protein